VYDSLRPKWTFIQLLEQEKKMRAVPLTAARSLPNFPNVRTPHERVSTEENRLSPLWVRQHTCRFMEDL
jgi:hypothetical protein